MRGCRRLARSIDMIAIHHLATPRSERIVLALEFGP